MLSWLSPLSGSRGHSLRVRPGWGLQGNRGVVSVPLYQAKAEFFRKPGHPVRIRVLELLRAGSMPAEPREAGVTAR